MSFNDLMLDRTTSFISRWNQRPDMNQRESLAEHCDWVVRLSMYLGLLLEKYSKEEIDWKLLMQTALIHDDPETITGDIAGHIKNLVPSARKDIKKWEQFVLPDLYAGLPLGIRDNLQNLILRYENFQDDILEYKIIKLADFITAMSYCKMQVDMGNTLFRPILDDLRFRVQVRLTPFLAFEIKEINDFWDYVQNVLGGKTV